MVYAESYIKGEHKKSGEGTSKKVELLGYFPADIKEGTYTIALQGYLGETLFIHNFADDLKIEKREHYGHLSAKLHFTRELDVEIYNVSMDLEEYDLEEIEIIVEDSGGNVIARGNPYKHLKNNIIKIWPFDFWLSNHSFYAKLDILTHHIEAGKNKITLVVDGQEIELGKTANSLKNMGFYGILIDGPI